MADITWADVEDIAPEMSTVIADAQTKILAYVNNTVDDNAFNNVYQGTLAKCYLAAHRGYFALASVSAGVTSKSIGSVSVSYGNSTDISTTSYGREYVNIVNNSPARCPIV